jgi:hypothetical protein
MTDLSRVRSALAAYDAATTYSATVRAFSGLAGAARELCAANPEPVRCARCGKLESADTRDADELCWCPVAEPGEAAPAPPQDAPTAGLLPDAAPSPVEPVAALSCGVGRVSDELTRAAGRHATSALDVDDLPEGDELELARRALAEPDPRHAVFTWDLVVRAFVAGATWQAGPGRNAAQVDLANWPGLRQVETKR